MDDRPITADTPPQAGPPRPQPPAKRRGRRSLAWLFGLVPIVLVVGAAAVYLLWWQPQQNRNAAPNANDSAAHAQPTPSKVLVGRDYYVFVKTIELYPQQADGGKWDAGNGGPDITYHLKWQDHVVYTSPTRDDTLIGLWDPIKFDVYDALMNGELEPSSTLNQGAIINITNGESITINVWDQDPTGLGSDAAGQIVLPVAELLQGDNVFTFEASENNAIKRLILGTTDTSQPIKNLVEALSNP